uniref:Uncharacterized protein n=1 Tax=Anopheles christyi TaxID=43041 RepID=A0A182K8A5_9DIPT
MSDRDRASPTLIETGLKTLIGGRDSNYPLISGTNGECCLKDYTSQCTCLLSFGEFRFRLRGYGDYESHPAPFPPGENILTYPDCLGGSCGWVEN